MSLARALKLIEAATGHIEGAGTLPLGRRLYMDEITEAKRALARALGELDLTEELGREQAGPGR